MQNFLGMSGVGTIDSFIVNTNHSVI